MEGEYHFDVDGLLYLKPDARKTYAMSKRHCEMIPGHRLGIYKTMQQYQMLGDFTTTTSNYCVCVYSHDSCMNIYKYTNAHILYKCI